MIDKETIGLIIENVEENTTKTVACVFDEAGGLVGSSPECLFWVQDKHNSIEERHMKVAFEEGFFTISPVEGSDIFYNNSFSRLDDGYEIIVNKGDVLKLGLIELRFVDSKEVKQETLKQVKEIKEIEKHTQMDEIELKPRGKIDGLDFKAKEDIKELIETKIDYSFIEDNNIKNSEVIAESSSSVNLDFTYENIGKMLDKLQNELSQNRKKTILSDSFQKLNIDDFQTVISKIPLVKDTKLINLVVLSLITKELYSPVFKEMDEDIFMNYLQNALQNIIKNDQNIFENLTLLSLDKYKDK
ncbi:type VI secretion system protein [Campylobacter subantarcticus LMG 24377]|uniref:Type VI secretion system protein n=1 Tax=Campylobacter subantarcticus TaxID=497724 RepID=A0ABW9N2K2_9BACT|nr:hypothetical protein [Campylobacter subantarcticus]AJC92590.1 type VI secretion system protein [Campylobacter subantarcticus LMG 24377]EAL3939768.1 hypothetical protein [Campylobacter lari]MPB98490.1 hypothetical protein [Campylobacter subantarcticus]